MKNIVVLCSALILCLISCASGPDVDKVMAQVEKQVNYQLTILPVDSKRVMPASMVDDQLKCVEITDWTSGFFPGTLWYLYEYTHDDRWKEKALEYTCYLDTIQFYTNHHDVGFMINCSYGNAYRLIGDSVYKQVLINAAYSLATRYRAKAKTIASWNPRVSRTGVKWDCPVIIDNMMNLELLFKASELSHDPLLAEIAIEHANTTLENHIRKDYSCFHVVNYDTITGKVTDKDTWQGFSRNSAWARGQAWAVYGFMVCYKETHDPRYLEVAEKMADFYLNHPNMPEDMIPYWDFNYGENGYIPDWKWEKDMFQEIPRDASASAIMASALIDLWQYIPSRQMYYKTKIEDILASLCSSKYLSPINTNGGFILMHSTGNLPRGREIDVPLNYADYYFLESLLKYRNLINKI
ncbi:glycoside hydrolase family 88 protein [Bacteroides difficilis]|uniref:Glycoside hydrolase family 88 protein n=1 Tax=Bacteroides difficilis TaxID=2763021 RepID=A0ABR7C802_9BACE|nr:glycoside hydrolase family 88 protein [Bacteroides difficilis]MBC5603925.1 glycoside hydrolase family 88 protein [Bacteroides difficilis]